MRDGFLASDLAKANDLLPDPIKWYKLHGLGSPYFAEVRKVTNGVVSTVRVQYNLVEFVSHTGDSFEWIIEL